MQQIFTKRFLFKKKKNYFFINNFWHNFHGDQNLLNYLQKIDEYDFLINVFWQFLKMYNLSPENYKKLIIIIKLWTAMVVNKSLTPPEQVPEKQLAQMEEKILSELKLNLNALKNANFQQNIEQDLFNWYQLKPEKIFADNHTSWNKIAALITKICAQSNADAKKSSRYIYKYFYTLAMQWWWTVLEYRLKMPLSISLFKIKIRLYQENIYAISQINPDLYNYFLKENNYYLHKYKTKTFRQRFQRWYKTIIRSSLIID